MTAKKKKAGTFFLLLPHSKPFTDTNLVDEKEPFSNWLKQVVQPVNAAEKQPRPQLSLQYIHRICSIE